MVVRASENGFGEGRAPEDSQCKPQLWALRSGFLDAKGLLTGNMMGSWLSSLSLLLPMAVKSFRASL